jgi:uncharacterized protein YbcI
MADSDTVQAAGLPADISSSLATVWKQYAGERPAEVHTEIRGTRVACVLKSAVQGFNDGMVAAEAADSEPGARVLTEQTYRRDVSQAVGRATKRRVMAFVSDHDAKTDVATEVFILDLPPFQPRSLFVDRRPD